MSINRMFLSWFDVLADNAKAKLNDTMAFIRRNLEFLGSRSHLALVDTTAEEAPDHATG